MFMIGFCDMNDLLNVKKIIIILLMTESLNCNQTHLKTWLISALFKNVLISLSLNPCIFG